MKPFLIVATALQLVLVILVRYVAAVLSWASFLGASTAAVIGYLYARSVQPTLWGGFVGGPALQHGEAPGARLTPLLRE